MVAVSIDPAGGDMNKRGMIFAAVVICTLATLAAAQGMSKKTLTISGKVTDDAKMIVSDDNEKWFVSNTDALMGREGQQITVKCRLDLEKNQVQILSFKPLQNEMKYAANKGDSAFRR